MNIALRRKTLKDGRESLFLDYYLPHSEQKRKKETLKLYLIPNPKSPKERAHNKQTLLLAESIRSKRLLDLQHDEHGFNHLLQSKRSLNFISYFAQETKKRYTSLGNYGSWDSTLKHLIQHSGETLLFRDVSTTWLEDFKNYLQFRARTKGNKPLSQNSCYSYFNKVRACLKQAMRDKIITHNPAEDVKGFKQGETERAFLTLEELKKVSQTECENPQIKRAFLFSALTGLRWSDIQKLTWQEIQHSEEHGYYIRFRQQKTKGVETLPISQQSRDLLGEAKDPEVKVFKGLKYSAWNNVKLQQWMIKAGITKSITFHCARHTYATLQLTLGTDIYTVSKLLGHRELKTTQVYAKIIDQKKVDAANIIPDLDL